MSTSTSSSLPVHHQQQGSSSSPMGPQLTDISERERMINIKEQQLAEREARLLQGGSSQDRSGGYERGGSSSRDNRGQQQQQQRYSSDHRDSSSSDRGNSSQQQQQQQQWSGRGGSSSDKNTCSDDSSQQSDSTHTMLKHMQCMQRNLCNFDVDKNDAAVVFVDVQSSLLEVVKDHNVSDMKVKLLALARAAYISKIPVVLTALDEDGLNGRILSEFETEIPNAEFVERKDHINPWKEEQLVSKLKQLGKKTLIMAGTLTNVTVALAAISAACAGYKVFVVLDASGASSKAACKLAVLRMMSAGVQVIDSLAFITLLMQTQSCDNCDQWWKIIGQISPSYRTIVDTFQHEKLCKLSKSSQKGDSSSSSDRSSMGDWQSSRQKGDSSQQHQEKSQQGDDDFDRNRGGQMESSHRDSSSSSRYGSGGDSSKFGGDSSSKYGGDTSSKYGGDTSSKFSGDSSRGGDSSSSSRYESSKSGGDSFTRFGGQQQQQQQQQGGSGRDSSFGPFYDNQGNPVDIERLISYHKSGGQSSSVPSSQHHQQYHGQDSSSFGLSDKDKMMLDKEVRPNPSSSTSATGTSMGSSVDQGTSGINKQSDWRS